MKYILILCCLFFSPTFAQKTPYELSNGKETATYGQVIEYYRNLDHKYNQAKLLNYGTTDFGEPLHLLVLSKNQDFDPVSIRKSDKRIFLINNGIHPGEPEGIDASMMLARDLLEKRRLPDNVVICIIPLYNIDGSFNRTGNSRANQNGPLAYGFRGNSKNYDLNRDFIKTDSENSASFQLIFNTWNPEIFVDTHTSNGADYQYTMTLIPTQKDKLQPVLSQYLTDRMVPGLYEVMKKKGFELIPYINSVGKTPESGIEGFLENPRFSTGYAALHNTIGFMPETHMLKSFNKRVESTYRLLETYIDLINKDARIIGENKVKADAAVATQQDFPLSWTIDTTRSADLLFKGYTARYKPSEVSGENRLYYDRTAPYTKTIKEWNHFKPAVTVRKPVAYIIPKAWTRVIHLLKLNQVEVKQLATDQELTLENYYIKDYQTSPRPYEGHYLHSGTQVAAQVKTMKYYAGDYVVFVNQPKNRYIVETLEPQATDSFFNWNFFDSILDQKEHFSDYVFEDTAAELLKKDPELKKRLEQEKAKNPELRNNARAQLNFVYQHSDYYEKTHLRYPVARLTTDANLNLR